MCDTFTSLLQSIHNSALLRGVCGETPLSYTSLAYLLHIYNSATPRLCIFDYTTIGSDVRHYYTTRKPARWVQAIIPPLNSFSIFLKVHEKDTFFALFNDRSL